jgi:hypothetical protein
MQPNWKCRVTAFKAAFSNEALSLEENTLLQATERDFTPARDSVAQPSTETGEAT